VWRVSWREWQGNGGQGNGAMIGQASWVGLWESAGEAAKVGRGQLDRPFRGGHRGQLDRPLCGGAPRLDGGGRE
jgi:hypothetical protein